MKYRVILKNQEREVVAEDVTVNENFVCFLNEFNEPVYLTTNSEVREVIAVNASKEER